MDFKLIDAIRIGYSIGNEKRSTDQFCIGKSLQDIRTRKINPFFHFLRFYLIIISIVFCKMKERLQTYTQFFRSHK